MWDAANILCFLLERNGVSVCDVLYVIKAGRIDNRRRRLCVVPVTRPALSYLFVGAFEMEYKDPRGRKIAVHNGLTGSKYAIRRGDRLYVSPAMWTLIRDCKNPDDLYTLLDKIPYRVVSLTQPLP